MLLDRCRHTSPTILTPKAPVKNTTRRTLTVGGPRARIPDTRARPRPGHRLGLYPVARRFSLHAAGLPSVYINSCKSQSRLTALSQHNARLPGSDILERMWEPIELIASPTRKCPNHRRLGSSSRQQSNAERYQRVKAALGFLKRCFFGQPTPSPSAAYPAGYSRQTHLVACQGFLVQLLPR